MAKEFSIKGVIKIIDDGATKNVEKIDKKLSALRTSMDNLKKSGAAVGGGLQVVAAAGTAAGLGFGMAVKQAASFEQEMAILNSVNELTAEQFQALQNEAMRLGAKTVFSSTEAVQGMVELTKAGLTVEQTLQAIPGVLSAAATEGLQLAQASEIVVGILQGQNLQMSEANRVSDVLARTANATAAGMTDLGEAFKYANALSQQGLMTFEDTAAALGMLSNAGMKGSVAGTSLVAMFNQITKPSKDVQKVFGGMQGTVDAFTDKATGKMKSLPEIINTISKAADAQNDDFMKMAFLTDFVGVEGAKAFGALQRAVNSKDSQGRPMFQGLKTDLLNAGGAAENMANKRLNSLTGALKIIESALQNASIMIGNHFMPDLREMAEWLKIVTGQAADAFMALAKAPEALTQADVDLINSPMGQFIKGVTEGLKEGIATVKWFVQSTIDSFRQLFPGLAGNNLEMGRMIAKMAVLAAAAAPLALGLLAIGMVAAKVGGMLAGLWGIIKFGGSAIWGILKFAYWLNGGLMTLATKIIPLVVGGLKLLWGVMVANPVGAIIAGITALVVAGYLLYKNWDTVKTGLVSIFTTIGNYFMEMYTNFVNIFSSFGNVIQHLLLAPFRAVLTPLMEIIKLIVNNPLGRKLLGTVGAGMVTEIANSVSLMPDAEIPKVVAPQGSGQVAARSVDENSVEQKRMATPQATEQANYVTVNQPPIEATFALDLNIDGQKLDRQLAKRSISNSERSGQTMSPKARQQMKNGNFAGGVK